MARTFHLFEAIKANIDWTPIHEQYGESVGKSLISLKPWAQSLAFMTYSPFLILRLKTCLTEMHNWLMSSSSQYTSCFFQHSFLWYLLGFLLLSCRFQNIVFLQYLVKYLHYCLTLCVDYLHLIQSLWDKYYYHGVCYSILCCIYPFMHLSSHCCL